MKVSSSTNINFCGYDAIPLKAFYMQGLVKQGEANIFREMKGIAQREGLDIFLNQDCITYKTEINNGSKLSKHLSIWGQDNKAFVLNKSGKTILWNAKEPPMESHNSGAFEDYNVDIKKYMPRGGNYYIGYYENGDKWLLVNGMSIADSKGFEKFGDTPTKELLYDLFDVRPENLHILTPDFSSDMDELVRPMGYPYILVNDYNLSLKNLEMMKDKFPNCYETYSTIKRYLQKFILEEKTTKFVKSADEICNILTEYGFKPIRIGGRYCDDINYMNALAFKNSKNGISYITNSTRKSYPELGYLEKLFELDLKEKFPNVTDTYFVSGGKRTVYMRMCESVLSHGLRLRNVIMDILANRLGGIHCMTAEVPDFDKIYR